MRVLVRTTQMVERKYQDGFVLEVTPRPGASLDDLLRSPSLLPGFACQQCGNVGAVSAVDEVVSALEQVMIWIWRYTPSEVNHSSIADFDPDNVRIGSANYHVVAAIVHSGFSAASGHYWAYVKLGGDWWLCNDNDVELVGSIAGDLKGVSFLILEKMQLQLKFRMEMQIVMGLVRSLWPGLVGALCRD